MTRPTAPGLLVIFGPPAVGKMTIAQAIAARSNYRVFHNHALLEPLLDVFDYGTAPFHRLLGRFRRDVLEEAAEAGVSLILTYAWALQSPPDPDEVAEYLAPYLSRGLPVRFVELAADLDTRLARNRTEHRLSEKKSKPNLDWSDNNVRELDVHTLNTAEGVATPADELLNAFPHLRLETAELSVDQIADRVLDWLAVTQTSET